MKDDRRTDTKICARQETRSSGALTLPELQTFTKFDTEHQSPTVLPMIKMTINNNTTMQTNMKKSTTL
jgi:hypothetical protein